MNGFLFLSVVDDLVEIPFGQNVDHVVGSVLLDLCKVEGIAEGRHHESLVTAFYDHIVHIHTIGIPQNHYVRQFVSVGVVVVPVLNFRAVLGPCQRPLLGITGQSSYSGMCIKIQGTYTAVFKDLAALVQVIVPRQITRVITPVIIAPRDTSPMDAFNRF